MFQYIFFYTFLQYEWSVAVSAVKKVGRESVGSGSFLAEKDLSYSQTGFVMIKFSRLAQ